MGDALLSHLSLLFVPAGVGVMLHAELIGSELLPIAGSVIVATMLTIVVTAWVMQLLGRRSQPE
jgi:holin-like protein